MKTTKTASPTNAERSYHIKGGVPLQGEIRISGAKNAASKELVASLLTNDPVTLENVPHIGEMDLTIQLLEDLGARISRHKGRVIVDASSVSRTDVSEGFSRKNRIPILLLGPLLHRFQQVTIPALGGDAIGARPVDFHIDALRKMGAEITKTDGAYVARAARLNGTVIELPYPSVMATENVMLAAVKAQGVTVIRNAAVEPEVVDLAMMLQSMGAIIYQDVNRTWVIRGVDELHGAVHRVIPDRIAAASFAIAAALTQGDVLIQDARQVDLLSFLNALRQVGAAYEIRNDGIRFMGAKRLQPIALETDVHPGFMTDWQQPFMMLLTQAHGVSILHETVYEDRFGYTEALRKMGAKIQLHTECLGGKACRYLNCNYRHSAVVSGPTKLRGASIVIPDIRAGFSYLLAALIAKGTSSFTGVEHIERGYGDVVGIFRSLGADIQVKG